MVVSPDCHSAGETARGIGFDVSKRGSSMIRQVGEPPGNPARRLAPVLRELSRPAAREQRDHPDCRHRHGGVLGVLHAEPVVSGASAAPAGGPRAVELRQPVRSGENPQRQSHSRHARPGGTGAAGPGLCRGADGVGSLGRAGRVPPARRSRADRARWQRILLLREDRLSAVLDAAAVERKGRVLPCHVGGNAGGTRAQSRRAAGAGVHRPARRQRQAGLREPGGPALVGRTWCAVCPAPAGLPGRRPVRQPADVRSCEGRRRQLRVHLQAGIARADRGIHHRG